MLKFLPLPVPVRPYQYLTNTYLFIYCYTKCCDLSVWMPQAPSIWAMIRCGPGGETAAPAKMAPRSKWPSLPAWSLRSFNNGLSLRPPPGMGAGHFPRPGGACDTCCNAYSVPYPYLYRTRTEPPYFAPAISTGSLRQAWRPCKKKNDAL